MQSSTREVKSTKRALCALCASQLNNRKKQGKREDKVERMANEHNSNKKAATAIGDSRQAIKKNDV